MPTERDKLALASDVFRYLATGKFDPGGRREAGLHDRLSTTEYSSHLREALIAEVRRLEQGHPAVAMPDGLNPEAYVRNKLYSLVKGLFSNRERENIIGMLVDTLVVMTPDNALLMIQEANLATAWKAADFYLASLGSAGLSGRADYSIVEDVGDYRLISMEYFDVQEPFVDHLVREAARLVCAARRGAAGLRQTKSRIWLIDMVPTRHQMFAHACEVYGRIRERSRGPVQRRKILREYASKPQPAAPKVERVELLRILNSAVDVRDGWKRILMECSDHRGRRRPLRRRPPHGRSGRTAAGMGPQDPQRQPVVVEKKVSRGRVPHLSTTTNPPGKGGTMPYNKTPLSISWRPAGEGKMSGGVDEDAPTLEHQGVTDIGCPLPECVPFEQQVQFAMGKRRLWGTLSSISVDGLCMSCSERIMEGEELRIFLPLPSDFQTQQLHLVQGKVVWRRGKDVMVLFTDLANDVTRQIQWLVLHRC